MFRVNGNTPTYFRDPYTPNTYDRQHDSRATSRSQAHSHYHRCDQDHRTDRARPDWRRDSDYPVDRARRARDYFPDRELPDTRRGGGHRPAFSTNEHRLAPQEASNASRHNDRPWKIDAQDEPPVELDQEHAHPTLNGSKEPWFGLYDFRQTQIGARITDHNFNPDNKALHNNRNYSANRLPTNNR